MQIIQRLKSSVIGLFVEYTFSVLLGKLEVCYGKPILLLEFLEEFDLSYHSLIVVFLTLNKMILPDHIQDTNKTEQNPAHCTSIGLLRSTIST